ncbi:MAG TPA: hypothetical protein VIW27_08000 [Gammaproteobacteria bacterium]|jgi:hypothetical protein
MQLIVEIDDKSYPLDVPEALCLEAADFFEKMDRDMSCGWQMSRWWVPDPDLLQRCQIAADKLLTAMQKDNLRMAQMMGAYILSKRPATRRIRLNVDGEIQGNEFFDE